MTFDLENLRLTTCEKQLEEYLTFRCAFSDMSVRQFPIHLNVDFSRRGVRGDGGGSLANEDAPPSSANVPAWQEAKPRISFTLLEFHLDELRQFGLFISDDDLFQDHVMLNFNRGLFISMLFFALQQTIL